MSSNWNSNSAWIKSQRKKKMVLEQRFKSWRPLTFKFVFISIKKYFIRTRSESRRCSAQFLWHMIATELDNKTLARDDFDLHSQLIFWNVPFFFQTKFSLTSLSSLNSLFCSIKLCVDLGALLLWGTKSLIKWQKNYSLPQGKGSECTVLGFMLLGKGFTFLCSQGKINESQSS